MTLHRLTCSECGEEFESKRVTTQVCSNKCAKRRSRAGRSKKRTRAGFAPISSTPSGAEPRERDEAPAPEPPQRRTLCLCSRTPDDPLVVREGTPRCFRCGHELRTPAEFAELLVALYREKKRRRQARLVVDELPANSPLDRVAA